MLTIEEADKIINRYVELRDVKQKDEKTVLEFKKSTNECIEKFKYIVSLKTKRYKNFNNYEDLNQEGLLALTRALKTYKPGVGNCFWWIHKYVDTRISRYANLHTTIKFPLQYTKTVIPVRESILPLLVDYRNIPDSKLECKEAFIVINKALDSMPVAHKKIVNMIFGINGETQETLNKVCKNMKMSRPTCIKILNQVLATLKQNVKL